MEASWTSYDPVAAVYDRVAAPNLFAPIAQDLAALLALPAGARVLDAGTGTVEGALAVVKSAGHAVGLDPSMQMLRLARRKGLTWLVCGVAPGLPFPDGVFDGVLANFVLNHVASYEAALADMVRVLRPGGRMAASAWGPLENEHRQLWRDLAESVIGKEALDHATRQAIPWEDWFSDPAHLRAAFEEAGLVDVAVREREHRARMAIDDYLAMREISMPARFAREFLGPVQWEHFRETVSNAFRARFRDPIEDTTVAYLCVGSKTLYNEQQETIMLVRKCDLCDQVKDCLAKEIDGVEYDICADCWEVLAAKLKGKGRKLEREMVYLPPIVKTDKEEPPQPRPGEPPIIWGADPDRLQ